MVLRVPPYAGECRFVRVTPVLIFARAPGLCCFCVGAKTPDSQGHLPPQPARAGSSRMAIPAATRRTGGPAAPDHTNASKHQRAQQARPSFTPAQAGPAATHAVPAAHHSAGGSSHHESRSTTTHSNEKCLLSISKPRRTMPTRSACRIAGSRTGGRPYRLVMHGSPQKIRARWQHVLADTGALVRDGACSIMPVAGEAPIGGRSRSRGPPVRRRIDERRGGGGARFVGTGCRRRGGEARAAVPRDAPGLPPPGAVRLRCPGERNGACRWLRPMRKSSDAPIRAVRVRMSRGGGGGGGRAGILRAAGPGDRGAASGADRVPVALGAGPARWRVGRPGGSGSAGVRVLAAPPAGRG